MIPLLHQGLHILALGQRGGAAEVADTPGFLAEFTAQTDGPKAPLPDVSADACLMAGMSVPAPAILPAPPTDPIPAGQAAAVTTTSSPVTPAEALQSAPSAVERLLANQSQPYQPLALARPTAPDTPPHSFPIAADLPPANALAAPVHDASRTAHATAVPAPDQTAGSIWPTQTVDLLTNQPIEMPLTAPLLTPATPAASPPQTRLTQMPEAYSSAQLLPVFPPAEDSAGTMPASPEQAQKKITAAESAWQTRVSAAESSKAQRKESASADRALLATVPPNANPDDAIATRMGKDSDALIAAVVQKDRALVVTLPSPENPALPTVSLPTAAGVPEPTPDAKAPTVLPAPDQISLQPAPDHTPQANHVPQAMAPPVQPPSLPLPAPPQVIAAPLADNVAAQLIHHADAAKTGEVDVLLAPEELGHVKFQIQQQADSVRIVLSAERPETLDLLRRHADQLLQDLRHSGFAQASLGFGQWGQQHKPPPPPPEPAAPLHTDLAEPWHATRQTPSTAAAASGHGLNLRL